MITNTKLLAREKKDVYLTPSVYCNEKYVATDIFLSHLTLRVFGVEFYITLFPLFYVKITGS